MIFDMKYRVAVIFIELYGQSQRVELNRQNTTINRERLLSYGKDRCVYPLNRKQKHSEKRKCC